VALFPQGVTAIRLAKAANAENPSDMAIVADRIAEFCPQGSSGSLSRK
jgi:hypothetical protein